MKILLTLLVASGFWFGFTKIYHQNQFIDSSRNAYSDREFQTAIDGLDYLRDSLEFESAGLQLNIAHANYHLNGFSGSDGTNIYNLADSSYLSKTQSALYEYTRLWEAENLIASRGYHQAGMVTFKSRIVNNKIAEELPLIRSTMDYFKNALRKDPFNEKARYNYEILKKYEKFPELLLEQVKSLVAQRRYREAYEKIAPYTGNPRFDQEYIKRLGDIVNIENTVQ